MTCLTASSEVPRHGSTSMIDTALVQVSTPSHILTPSSLILCTSHTMSRVVCRLHPSHIPHPHSHTLLLHLCTLHAICTTSLSFQPNLCTHLLSRPIPSPFPSYRLHTEDIWGSSHSPDGSPKGGLPWRRGIQEKHSRAPEPKICL